MKFYRLSFLFPTLWLICTSQLAAWDDLKKSFFEEHPFWEDGGWCDPDDHPFFKNIHSAKCPFFYLSFSSNNPDAKSLFPQTAAMNFAFSYV